MCVLAFCAAASPALAQFRYIQPQADPFVGRERVVQPEAAQAQKPSGPSKAAPAPQQPGLTPPADYVIGIGDVLAVEFWGHKELTMDPALVRPDGKISLRALNDVAAHGLTVDELVATIARAASAAKLVEEPTVFVAVKEINSRKVSITGAVGKAGQYPLLTPTTVVELISMAGGVADWADRNNVRISRVVNGKRISIRFRYKDFMEGKPEALEQNIELLPNDIVTVPE